MRKDSQLGEFLIKISRNSWCALSHSQDFGNHIVLLPTTAPSFPGRGDRQLGVQVQVTHADSLKPGQGSVPGAGLQALPTLLFETDHLHLLAALLHQILESFGKTGLGFVDGRMAILVGDSHQGASIQKVLADHVVAPEAGVVQRGVSMLVNGVHVTSFLY